MPVTVDRKESVQNPNGTRTSSPQDIADYDRAMAGNNVTGRPGQDNRLTIDPNNYRVATDNDYITNAHNLDAVQNRQGVQIDNRAADGALAQALQARGAQQMAANMYGAAAAGMAPSAADYSMRAALDARAQQQARMAGQGGAQRALMAGGAAYGQAAMQGAQSRQQETQAAYNGAAGVVNSMRGGDLDLQRQSLQAANAQAQMEAAQRARNDAMAKMYQGQRTGYGIEQLGADQAYENQYHNDAMAARGLRQQQQQQRDANTNTAINVGMKAGTLLASIV